MLVATVVAGCSVGHDATPSPPTTAVVTRPSPEPTPTPEPRITTPAPPPSPVTVRPPSRARVPGRAAPDATAGPLRITQVFVDTSSGRYVVRANVTNTSSGFLNDVALDWVLRTSGGARVDSGSAAIATVAPAETTTVSAAGSAVVRDGWSRVAFTFRP